MNLFDFSETAPELEPGQVSGIRLWAPSKSMDEIAGISKNRDLSGMDAIARGEFVPNPKIGAPSFSANVGGGILSGVAGMLGAGSKIGSYINPGRYIDALTGENFFGAKAGAEYGESLKPEFEEIGRRTGAYDPESVGATVGEIAPSMLIPGGGFLRAVKGAKGLSTAKKLADVAIGGALGGAVGGAAESGTEGVLPGAAIGAAGGVAVGGALMGASRLLKGKPVEELISSAITPLQKTREGKVIRPQSKINEQIRTTTQDIVSRGEKPTNLAEYEQSVRKGMNEIYTKHITPAVDASKSVVDLRGIAGKVRAMAEKEGLEEVIAPGQVQRIEALADFLEKKGSVSLPEAERIKQYVNANADFGVFGQERLLNNALKSLTSELGTKMDEALGSIGGKQASEWKKLYGAYSELLYDISKASIKYERQPQVGFFEGLGRLGGAGDIVSGIFTADPKQVLRGLATTVQGKIIRELNDKNNLVRKAFEKAAKEMPTPRVAPVSPVANVKTKTVDVSELTPTPPVAKTLGKGNINASDNLPTNEARQTLRNAWTDNKGLVLPSGSVFKSNLPKIAQENGVTIGDVQKELVSRGYIPMKDAWSGEIYFGKKAGGLKSQKGLFLWVNAKAKPPENYTGWFKGADGKLRFEIDDSVAKVNVQKIENGAKLWDVLEHPELFKNYPEIKDVNIEVVPQNSRFKGSYDPETNTLSVSKSVSDIKSTFLHEIQHAIQEVEWFAKWTSKEAAFRDPRLYPTTKEELKRTKKAWEIYEAKLKELSTPMTKEQFAKTWYWTDKITKEIESDYKDYVKSLQDPKRREMIEKWAQDFAAEEWYKSHAWEVESRNVQSRMNLTMKERLAKSAESTEDVPRSKQIIRTK